MVSICIFLPINPQIPILRGATSRHGKGKEGSEGKRRNEIGERGNREQERGVNLVSCARQKHVHVHFYCIYKDIVHIF